MSHGDGLDELSAALTAGGVEHVLYHDCIHISLLETEGHLEVKAWRGHPHSVSLTVRGEWVDLGEIKENLAFHSQFVVQRVVEQMRRSGVEPVKIKDSAA
jgi:hypothetical protein